MAKRIITLVVTLALIAGLVCGGVYLFRSCNQNEKDDIEYKPSYISGDYYARNNVNSDKVDMTCTEKALGIGYTFTFKYTDIEGYEVKTIKCSAPAAVIDVAEDKTVTVQLNADDLNKDTFSVMVIYRKVD